MAGQDLRHNFLFFFFTSEDPSLFFCLTARLHGGGEPQLGEATRLSIKSLILI